LRAGSDRPPLPLGTESRVGAWSREGCTLPRVIPWIIIAVVAVPLVVIGFVSMRRRTAAGEPSDAHARAEAEQEFAEAEAYEAKWHEEDKERYHQERLP